MTDYFKTALKDFASDVAYGDSIRHLVDIGMTVEQISRNLTYPASIEQIQSTVWKYYIQTGTILLEKPDNSSKPTKTTYVLDHDKYGRSSYRKVEEPMSNTQQEYVECDFGKLIYIKDESFINSLEKLNKDDRSYILDLPWPITTVYHIKNERMERILKSLGTVSS